LVLKSFHSSSNIQPDKSYIFIAETCSRFTCSVNMYTDCNHTSFLCTRKPEHNSMSCIQTATPMFHLMLDYFHHRVQFRNISRFWWRNWESEKIGGERERWEGGVVFGLDTAGCVEVQW